MCRGKTPWTKDTSRRTRLSVHKQSSASTGWLSGKEMTNIMTVIIKRCILFAYTGNQYQCVCVVEKVKVKTSSLWTQYSRLVQTKRVKVDVLVGVFLSAVFYLLKILLRFVLLVKLQRGISLEASVCNHNVECYPQKISELSVALNSATLKGYHRVLIQKRNWSEHALSLICHVTEFNS